MSTCPGRRNNSREKCGQETRQGYKYCDDCIEEGRPKAVQDAQRVEISKLSAPENVPNPMEPKNEIIPAAENLPNVGEVAQHSPKNIVDQISNLIQRMLDFEEEAHKQYETLRSDDWTHVDKTGIRQLNPLVGVKERALDRAGRIFPMIAKLGIEQQAVIIEKAQYEGIKRAVNRTFQRVGFDDTQLREANKILAEELRNLMG